MTLQKYVGSFRTLFVLHFVKIVVFALLQRDLPWELDSTLRTLGRTNLNDTLGAGSDPQNFGSHIRTFRQGRALFCIACPFGMY